MCCPKRVSVFPHSVGCIEEKMTIRDPNLILVVLVFIGLVIISNYKRSELENNLCIPILEF